jgi:hypothetical protein
MLSRISWSQFLGGCLLLLSSPYLVLAANFDVNVAQTGLSYTPDNLDNVAAQDTVTFHFSSGPHSATQGSFQSPCSPLSGGFDSGLYVHLGLTAILIFIIIIIILEIFLQTPIWIYQYLPDHRD